MPSLPTSSVPASSPRCTVVTSEQFVTALLLACTAATSASRTWGVRSHTPPVNTAVDPSTLCAALAASASWSGIATPLAFPKIPLPGAPMPFAGTAMPSSSTSVSSTV